MQNRGKIYFVQETCTGAGKNPAQVSAFVQVFCFPGQVFLSAAFIFSQVVSTVSK